MATGEEAVGMSARDTEVRLPRATHVKNKQPADKQVSLRSWLLLIHTLRDA